jgi:UDP-N-acetylmuramoyl-tripeptide--D-alanyl-D-alanine ligase
MKLTLGEWRDATNGEILAGDPGIFVGGNGPGGLSIDSRAIEKGQWFIALIGVTGRDGHDYLKDAIAAGAGGVIVSDLKAYESTVQADYPNLPALLVEGTTLALGDAARSLLDKFSPFVIAITGTVGKTGVKENIAHLVGIRGPVLKTRENWNTEIGLPLTVFEITPEHKVAVLECAARGPGQVHYLSMIARPDVAVIIGPGHLSEFGTLEEVAKAKWEIVDGLKDDGVIIADMESIYTGDAGISQNMITFGLSNKCTVHPLEIKILNDSTLSVIATPHGSFNTEIPGSSRADLLNALAAVACVQQIPGSLTLDEIASALKSLPSTPGRLEKIIRASGIEVIFDGYNSNPISLANALELLARRKTLAGGGEIERRVAILGDMLELGEEEEKYHLDAGTHVANLNIDVLLTVGNLAKYIGEVAVAAKQDKIAGNHYESTDECARDLGARLMPGDLVLIKASRSLEFEKLLETDW